MIKLTSFFSNRMILQRGFEENRIWGYTAPGAKLSLSLVASEHAEGDGEPSHFESIRADMQGYFSFLLPFMDAGGPWRIVIEDEEERKVLEDVYFGDVFLLGGQSNMELPLSFSSLREEYGDELSGADYGLIRQFEVPKEYDFNEKRKMLTEGKWVKASGEELLTFSAAGFFAAKAIYEKKKIPIGLYQTAVGGTPVKAWCAPDTVKELGLDEKELSECADSAYVVQTIEKETAWDKEWRKRAMEPFQTERAEEWREFVLPALFSQTELRDFVGSLCFTRSFTLTEEQKKKTAVLHFGAMIDADEIYINGVLVGETDHRYPPRIYPVPEGVLRSGENQIEVRLLVFGEGGGFMPGKAYDLTFVDGERLSLAGEWLYAVKREMEPLEQMTFFQYKASGLYRGMLCPIQGQRFRGVFFYQGESNTERAGTYQREFAAMVKDWRTLFHQERLPFFFVQLAGYSDGIERTEGVSWAELREEQRKCAEIPFVEMIQAYDLGEYNDLHPVRKKEVGERIADAVEAVAYEGGTYLSGPVVHNVLRKEGKMEIQFEEGLQGFPGDVELIEASESAFEYGLPDGSWHPAAVRRESREAVVLMMPEKVEITGVRYAWRDCPFGRILYSEDGLPVVPFCKALGTVYN